MGIYRFLLACCVVVAHLAEDVQYVSHAGMFAVFGFYVLSGYLITRVLNGTYGFAFVPFWSNRFLRLYPPYFIFLLIGLALVLGTERATEFFPTAWKSHPALSDWIGLISVFPMGVSPLAWSFRPVPSIWSVGVELLNYAVLYAAVARRKDIALLVAVAAAAYHLFSLWRGDDLSFRYFPFHAALLPFALGALIYFHTRSSNLGISLRTAMLMCVPVAANGVLAGLLGGAHQTPLFEAFFYLNLAFQCLAVAALSRMTRAPSPRLDKLLGDLSYPVFLCHWLVGYVIAMLLFPGQSRGIGLMIATLVASTGVAYIVCRLQDAIVEPLRSRIRTDAATSHQAPDAKALLVRT